MDADTICQYLEWDSNFFSRRIGRVNTNTLTPIIIEQVMRWCEFHHIDCLYFLTAASDTDTIQLAEDNRFRLVDIRVTLERRIEGPLIQEDGDLPDSIRPFKSDDVPALRAIARTSHRDTRFYHDPNFPDPLCDALYETWIEKSCYGYADTVLVAELGGQPVGYLCCQKLNQDGGQISLVGVDPSAQKMGLGKKLVGESLRWFAACGVLKASVVTQGRNCPAQRMYQGCGFMTHAMQLWYHRWFHSEENRRVK